MMRAMVRGLCLLAAGFWSAAPAAEGAAAPQEEIVTLEVCPAPVQATLKKAAAGGTIVRVRKVLEGAATTYKADIAIAVDSSGNLLPPPAVDPVLSRPVTVSFAGVRLQDVCRTLSQAAGVPVTCGGTFAERPVTLSVKEVPLGDVLKAIAEQTGTRADPRDGGYRFRTGGR